MFLRKWTIFCPQSQTKHGEATVSHCASRRKTLAPTLFSFKSRLKTSLFHTVFDVRTSALWLYCLLSQESLQNLVLINISSLLFFVIFFYFLSWLFSFYQCFNVKHIEFICVWNKAETPNFFAHTFSDSVVRTTVLYCITVVVKSRCSFVQLNWFWCGQNAEISLHSFFVETALQQLDLLSCRHSKTDISGVSQIEILPPSLLYQLCTRWKTETVCSHICREAHNISF